MGKAANVAKKAAWAEEKSLSAESNVREVDVTRGAANGAGESELFEKKLSKEEKKAAAAAAKADRALRKAAAGETVEEDDGEVDDLKKSMSSSSLKSKSSSGSLAKKGKKMTASEKAASDNAELEAELLAARVRAAEERTRLGAYKGALEAASFTLPNPGGGAPLLEDASFTLVRGRRYALIGRNGKGKSTLLRALAARRYGNIPANVSVFYVRQEVHLTEVSKKQTPAQCIVAADIERAVLMKECAIYEADGAELTEAQQKRHCEVLEQLEVIEADSAPRRAEELLIGLGFSEELRNRPLEALSGGWRVRTMLAAAIFARPDLLLLDEPTNHLSIGAVMWLARELATSETWKERTVVIVSHDRFFLDEVCGDCLHISGAARRLTQSHGNYSTWFQRRCDQRALYEKEKLLRENEIDKLKEFAGHGFKYGGSSSAINKMKMKEKQAGKLEVAAEEQADDLAALQEDQELPLKLCAGGSLDGFLVQVIDMAFKYPGTEKLLMQKVEMGVTSTSRIVLLGENGNGKTTLVKLMLGELTPTSGTVRINAQCRVALVNQHHADQLDLTKSPLEYMLHKFKQGPPPETAYEHLQKLRGHLAGCGVPGHNPDLQNVPAAALSGGQRSRVALAEISFRRPHVLVLDEPTNNLDLESVAALAEAVKNFDGAVICVSHDQFFVNEIANEAWVVEKQAVKKVESFDAYRKKQLQKLDATAALALAQGAKKR
ncbi:P-loop containing nucleoside triphosphate hydrolase protein [Pelagophyceae sp. CCMP2097]|nr:P-loop containing nucleoside triphosphate hydrolase protein [Pelagophyceae sp. CCMP2097]